MTNRNMNTKKIAYLLFGKRKTDFDIFMIRFLIGTILLALFKYILF